MISKEDWQVVFGSEEGKRVLNEILSFAHVLEAPSMEVEPHAVMFKAGRRDTAMFILEQLNQDNFLDLLNA